MRAVEDHLVAGVSMDRAHDAALDRSIIVQCLRHRSEAVRGAGSSGDDGVISRQGLLVYAVNDRREIVACRSGNNDLLCACVDVSLALSLRGVEAGALENNVNTDLAPRKVLSVLLSVDLQGLAVNCDGVSLVVSGNRVESFADLAAVTALCGVILEQVSQHGGLRQIVDRNDLITLSAEHLSERQTADTAETIDCNFNCHDCIPPDNCGCIICNSIL